MKEIDPYKKYGDIIRKHIKYRVGIDFNKYHTDPRYPYYLSWLDKERHETRIEIDEELYEYCLKVFAACRLGEMKSAKKAAASRRNGKKGGRPNKVA